MKFTNDKYKRVRGGYSRLLRLSCESCGEFLCNYQKDGPGLLKRMYLDRISDEAADIKVDHFACPSCQKILGTRIVYEKENRPAIRLLIGAVNKKIIKTK